MNVHFERIAEVSREAAGRGCKRNRSWFMAGLLLFAGLLWFPGCFSASPNRDETGAQLKLEAGHSDDHESHAHEHEHEHHDPEHKPKNFPEAVARLQEWRSEGADQAQPGSESWEQTIDIINWLTELAAESELNETQWNRVDSSAGELQKVLQQSDRDAAAWKRFDAALAQLAQAVADYRAAEAVFMRPMREAETEPEREGE